MHSDWFNGIEIIQGRWQHGEKVGYCYLSGLEKTLFKWEIYVPFVTKGLSEINIIQLCLQGIRYHYCSFQSKIFKRFINYNRRQLTNKNIIRAAQVRFDFQATELGLRGPLIGNLIKICSSIRELDAITAIS
jgi:hypothetical protein